MDKIGNIYEVINNLKSVLPTTNQLKLYLDELNDVENIDQQPYNLNSFFISIYPLNFYFLLQLDENIISWEIPSYIGISAIST